MTVIMYSVVDEDWGEVCTCISMLLQAWLSNIDTLFMQDSGWGGVSLHVIPLAFELWK